jgi:hypothetical protein
MAATNTVLSLDPVRRWPKMVLFVFKHLQLGLMFTVSLLLDVTIRDQLATTRSTLCYLLYPTIHLESAQLLQSRKPSSLEM